MQTRRKQVSKRGVDALVREPERLGIVSKGWDDGRGLGGVVGLLYQRLITKYYNDEEESSLHS